MGVITKFIDCTSDVCTTEISVEDNDRICIFSEDLSEDKFISFWMDVETAVKFSKELRRQIAIAKDNQLNSEDNE